MDSRGSDLGVRKLYRFQCQCAEVHGQYHIQSLLLWDGPEGEEWVAGDSHVMPALQLDGGSEHADIIACVMTGLSRIAAKYDRTLF